MKLSTLVLVAEAFLCVALPACSTAPKSEAGKADIRSDADSALARAQTNDPTLAPVIRNSVGYAIFPKIGKGGLIVGGAYGKGVVYEGPSGGDKHFVGYCDLTQGTFGAQIGGQSYSELITFSTTDALSRFKNGNFTFDAQATAVAVKAGRRANARYSNGVAVFTFDEAGLMAEASVGGQKFAYVPE